MKKFITLLLFLFATNAPHAWGQEALVISQYYEGASNDKLLEVTNMGTATIDFSVTPYYLCLFSNTAADSPSTDAPTACYNFTGTLTSGSTVILKHSSAVNPTYAISGAIASTSTNYNGDDLVIITTSNSTTTGVAWTARTDVVGDGTSWGQDTSFSRNLNIAPQTTWNPANFTVFTVAAVDAATSGNNEYIGTYTGYTALPIELAGFQAKVSDNEAMLQWTTASESNNDRFEVQHKVGNTWQTVATVKGAGTSIASNNYTANIANLAAGYHTFRLKQVDYDGTVSYSDEVRAMVELKSAFQLSDAYPNPFNPTTAFSLTVAQDQHVKVEVYDLTGRLVQTLFNGSVAANEIQHFNFDASALSSGTYLYRVIGDKFVTSKTFKLVK